MVGRSVRSMTFQRGHSGQGEVVGQVGVGQDDDVVPAQPALAPAGVLLDEVAQRVAGFAGLADGVDLVLVAAALLPPGLAVVPDLAALDLEADDAGALDGDEEVDLVVLEVVGDALAGDDEVAGLELVDQRLPDAAFGAVGQPRCLGDGDGHAAFPFGSRSMVASSADVSGCPWTLRLQPRRGNRRKLHRQRSLNTASGLADGRQSDGYSRADRTPVCPKSSPFHNSGSRRSVASAYERQSPKFSRAGCPLPLPKSA